MKVIFLLLLSVVTFSSTAEQEKNQTAIRVLINDWTSQKVLAHITGEIYKSLGYTVEYQFSTTNEQWGSLSHGIDHVQVEVWQGTMAQMFERVVKSGRVLDAGSHDAKTREDWWYPEYVEALCPGLPDWKALKTCSAIFATEQGSIIGRYLAGPWEKPESAKIRALSMNFVIEPVSKAEDLWVELDKAYRAKKPIVLFNWTPNWVEAVYKGKFVEFPAYHPACEVNPDWGVNSQFLYDCGNPKNGWLKKAAWSGMPDKWPCAYATLQQINFDNDTIAMLSAWVDHDKMSLQQAATRWLTENSKHWQKWIPISCQQASAQ